MRFLGVVVYAKGTAAHRSDDFEEDEHRVLLERRIRPRHNLGRQRACLNRVPKGGDSLSSCSVKGINCPPLSSAFPEIVRAATDSSSSNSVSTEVAIIGSYPKVFSYGVDEGKIL